MNALRRPGLRLVAEAAVIVLAAVIAGVLDMGAWGIIAVVAVVWVVVSIIEYAVSHESKARARAQVAPAQQDEPAEAVQVRPACRRGGRARTGAGTGTRARTGA